MSKEMRFFIYLLENYADYKEVSAKDIFNKWNKLNISKEIFDRYELYHIEKLENAYADIDKLTEENI